LPRDEAVDGELDAGVIGETLDVDDVAAVDDAGDV
jgi:hypothetical protein